jgi:DNA segregation ATPase FtsK/SpoIIIE, S-DNA-T family
MTHYALVIGNSTYDDPKISSLNSPLADISGLVEVLTNPKIGDFQPEHIVQLSNATYLDMRLAIIKFFEGKSGNDTVLCYFSGHGQKDEDGDLFLLTRDTESRTLSSKALEAAFLAKHFERCAAQRKILILDCCYSGAYLRGSKALLDQPIDTKQIFEGNGYGRFVLTSSDATKLSWDGEKYNGEVTPSVFTGALIKGLQSGDADTDGDGHIGLRELFNYIEKNLLPGTNIKPSFNSYKEEGDLVFARSIRGERHARLPDELQEQLISPNTDVREAAVRRLGQLLQSPRPKLVEQARERLRQLIDEDDSRRIEKLAQRLLDAASANNLANTLPERVSLLELLQCTDLAELEQLAAQQWARSREAQHADWLRVPLGKTAPDTQRILRLSAKYDGVHGLIAGSTGSGKSELLMSLVLGLAVQYDPTMLNIVLVDYKGGSVFHQFAHLPHCVDILTNLTTSNVTRLFAALQFEIQRRRALNVATGTNSIVEYRQQNLHNTHEPYPFLFIIIDEFAEMLADRAEYMVQLEAIARVGRAQGVSLILATQRPAGSLSEQLRANLKLRICLRVETSEDSREVLQKPDAVSLPPDIPGRAYLRTGSDELELLQTAYTDVIYTDPQLATVAPVIWPDREGSYELTQDVAPPELYKLIINSLQKLARKQQLPPQSAPWPTFLPTYLTLVETLLSANPGLPALTDRRYLPANELLRITLGEPPEPTLTLNPALHRWLQGKPGWVEPDPAQAEPWAEYWGQYALRPVVGLLDNPSAASQLPLVIDLPHGHTAIYGDAGWGKSTFLCSIALSLAASHSPNYAHLYLLDFGGRGLAALRDLPHVGALISPDEESFEERIGQLLHELDKVIRQRITLLSMAGQGDIYAYNQAHPNDPQPALVILLDHFAGFQAIFNERAAEPNDIMQRFIGLLRQARPYGVHMVVSATQAADLSNVLMSLFNQRFTLRLADSGAYQAIVGAAVDELGLVPGRGYTRVGEQLLAFQVALPLDLRGAGTTELADENREIELLAWAMDDYLEQSPRLYQRPLRIDRLPKFALLKQLLAREYGIDLTYTQLRELMQQRWIESRDAAKQGWLRALIGVVSGNRPRILQLEARADGVHGLIAGGTGSGKSELLITLITSLAINYAPDILNFVLIDYKGGGVFSPFEQLPHVVESITNVTKNTAKRTFIAIHAEMERRQRLNSDTHSKDIIDYRARGFHLTRAPYPHLFIIIDEFAEMISDNPELAEELDSITRLGRSLGVNLLLAAQRLVGISNQMRANSKLRICLRVEQIETSQELLRRPDAALLPNGMPGRGYLQVGNETTELIQVAYTGERFSEAPVNAYGEAPPFYEAVVQLAQELPSVRPSAPWPPALPAEFALDSPLPLNNQPATALSAALVAWRTTALERVWPGADWQQGELSATIGVIDEISQLRQRPLIFHFRQGHLGVFGTRKSGKTNLLQIILTDLAASYRPDEVQFLLLDLNGTSFAPFADFPHVLGMLHIDHHDFDNQIAHWFDHLTSLIEQRERLLHATGHNDLQSYNLVNPEASLPTIIVMIDDLSMLENGHANLFEARLPALAGRMKKLALHLIVAEADAKELPKRLLRLLKQRISFFHPDQAHYNVLFNNALPAINAPGYGYIATSKEAGQIQIAFAEGYGKIARLGSQMKTFWEEHFGLAQEGGFSAEDQFRKLETMQAIIIAAMREQFATSGTSPLAEHFVQLTPPQWYDTSALMAIIQRLAASDQLSISSETALLQYYRERYTT